MKIIGIVTGLFIVSASLGAQTPVYLDETKPIEDRVEDALGRMTLEEKIAMIHAQSKFSSPGVQRLGIPEIWTTDGPHGIRAEVRWDEWVQAGWTNDSCVAFPALTCLAATWNEEMAALYGKSIGEEARYREKDVLLGPGVNIYRTPLNGRNFEYMGEDPYLAGTMVVPYVRGVQSNGVAACVKHYALNNHEVNRHNTNVIVDDRTLYEIYLPAFKAAVQEGGAWAIMGSYNLYKDMHCCHNEYTLDRILKGEWGFDGVVISDWGGTHNTDQAIANGLDMEFGTWTNGLHNGITNSYDSYFLAGPYIEKIRKGEIGTEELDEKVRRVLRLAYRTVMDRTRPLGSLCSEAHYAAARKIAGEGIVLLKNDGILPFDRHKKTAVIGPFADEKNIIGAWAIESNADKTVTVLNGCRKLSECVFAKGCSYEADCNDESGFEAALYVAAQAENVILCVGEFQNDAGEAKSKTNLHIPHIQKKLIHKIVEVNPNTAVILFNGRPLLVDEIEEISPAVLEVWQPGIEGGNGIAELLFGLHSPCGKLTMTFPRNIGQIPIYYNHLNTGRPQKGENKSFCSYYIDSEKSPLHPFGFGLSYAEFSISSIKLDKTELEEGGKLTASVIISNKSDIAARTIVQLYIRDMVASVCRPVKELKNFIPLDLCANEDKIVSFEIVSEMLGFYDAEGTYKIEEGLFELYIGFDSATDNCTRFYYMGKLHERRI